MGDPESVPARLLAVLLPPGVTPPPPRKRRRRRRKKRRRNPTTTWDSVFSTRVASPPPACHHIWHSLAPQLLLPLADVNCTNCKSILRVTQCFENTLTRLLMSIK